jgi:hypothetical protein
MRIRKIIGLDGPLTESLDLILAFNPPPECSLMASLVEERYSIYKTDLLEAPLRAYDKLGVISCQR